MRLDLRLALPAAACWASAGLLVAIPAAAAMSAALLTGAAGVLMVVAALLGAPARAARRLDRPQRRGYHRRRPGRLHRGLLGPVLGTVAVCAAAAALAAVAVAVQAPARSPEALRTALEEHTAVSAALTVWSAPVPSAGVAIGGSPQLRFRATLTALRPADPGPAADAGVAGTGLSVPVVVFADTAPNAASGPGAGPLSIGDEIRLSGTVAPTDPGDAAAALFFGRGSPETERTAPWWLDWANSLRHGFAAAAGELPGEGAGLLPGLAIGDTTGVGADLDQAMTTSSLSHLTAVSGDTVLNRGETEIRTKFEQLGRHMSLGRLDRSKRSSRNRTALCRLDRWSARCAMCDVPVHTITDIVVLILSLSEEHCSGPKVGGLCTSAQLRDWTPCSASSLHVAGFMSLNHPSVTGQLVLVTTAARSRSRKRRAWLTSSTIRTLPSRHPSTQRS